MDGEQPIHHLPPASKDRPRFFEMCCPAVSYYIALVKSRNLLAYGREVILPEKLLRREKSEKSAEPSSALIVILLAQSN